MVEMMGWLASMIAGFLITRYTLGAAKTFRHRLDAVDFILGTVYFDIFVVMIAAFFMPLLATLYMQATIIKFAILAAINIDTVLQKT
jgi:hypothetical protein